MPHGRRPVERQLRPEARGARGAEQRVPARAARGGPDRRDRPRVEDPPEEPHPRRAVERGAGSDLRPPPRGLRPAHALHRAVPRRRRDGTTAATPTRARTTTCPIEEKLKQHIIDGEKRNLIEHLDEALKTYPPLDIINNILLEGMKVVGELFGSGQMQLPFVLQTAETMKAAVAHLEPHMEKVEGSSKGKIVLATVKGDVHDIGKNLVDIILTNNGYTVYNLGIKQPIDDILTRREGEEGRRDRHERAAREDRRGDEGEPRGDERQGRERARAARRRGADARLRRGRPGRPCTRARCCTAGTRSTACT